MPYRLEQRRGLANIDQARRDRATAFRDRLGQSPLLPLEFGQTVTTLEPLCPGNGRRFALAKPRHIVAAAAAFM